MISKIRATITAHSDVKDDRWYMDSAAAVHVTHDLSLYVSTELDDQYEWIETVSGELIKTCGAGTINLDVSIDGRDTSVYLLNVHYCPKIDSNLLCLGILEAKDFEFVGRRGYLKVHDDVGDLVLVGKRENLVYPLMQPNQMINGLTTKALATKLASKDFWHQRAGHINYRDLTNLPNVADRVQFEKNSGAGEMAFCEACTLGKQHKVHHKGPAAH